jgi:hypothetical protein
VDGWYAYDADSVFLPEAGGSFAINLGAAPADVTHITGLPARARLLSLSGDGVALDFSVLGEGRVVLDLAAYAGMQVVVTGAQVASLVGERLELSLGAIGRHDVSVRLGGQGSALNDSLAGGAGDDTLDGGTGVDTAVFHGRFADFTVEDRGPGGFVVTGPDGRDLLLHMERLLFADGAVTLDDGDPLFDSPSYLAANPDVYAAGVDPLRHFRDFGWKEGRDPNALFDTTAYLAANPDVKAAGIDPLQHYRDWGWWEGRGPGPAFDGQRYRAANPDVAAAGIDPLAHYLTWGQHEGRAAFQAVGHTITDGFDAEFYLMRNADVAAAGVDPRAHYRDWGWREGRDPNAVFDAQGYLAAYRDVAAAGVDPLGHYMRHGAQEGRDPSAGFDTMKYLGAYRDVAAAGMNPLEHYLRHGYAEGRLTFGDGAWAGV